MKLRLELKLSQRLIMTPQLQQAIKLLQLSRLELSQVVSQELIENPLLEETGSESDENESAIEDGFEEKDPPEEETTSRETGIELKSQWEEYITDIQHENKEFEYSSSGGEELPSYEQTLTRPPSLWEHLTWQLRLSPFDPSKMEIGKDIIGNIDDDGYLRSSLEEIGRASQLSAEDVHDVLKVIQLFDPVGVGARDLRECLLIQIDHLGLRNSLAGLVVSSHLKDIESRRFQNIARALDVSLDEVFQVVKVIRGLEPKPGRPFFSDVAQIIIPDIYVVKSGNSYVVTLNDDGLPKLRISPYYRRLLSDRTKGTDQTRDYLAGRFRSAVWLVRSIEQRNRTICKVAESIVKFELDFFEKGVGRLRPLVLRQVAEDISMHESTISRVTTNKYMHTPQGIFELKYFFNSGVPRGGQEGGEVSSVSVREMIREMVSRENPEDPIKDQEIVARLQIQKISIARRTVAKYRAELKIPQASRRRYIS